ncbi:MAG: MltA domain-containing protein, partial [Syntrophales bacterium]|nr:MltA domain-containing protein [Syntrophales bacterium]
SGQIRLPEGTVLRVNYAASNGRPFRGLARFMVSQGLIDENQVGYQAVKSYLMEHPERREEIMNHNESYVFFRIVPEGPLGALGRPVVAHRSIATDLDIFPRGALAWIALRKPRFDGEGKIVSWLPLRRFVLNHDAGGAIKGPGRVDLFCGTGSEAERLAGSLSERGALYFLVKKRIVGEVAPR